MGRSLAVGSRLMVLIALAGCATATIATPGLAVGGAWVRAVATTDQATAGYLTIANASTTADALLSASSPGAATVGIHKSEMDSTGLEWMHPVDHVDVPANGTVALEPGGYHLMIEGLTAPLRAGDRLELDLVFQRAGRIVVLADIRDG
ncbi:MAG: copper chaperone PCu(A)C [Candidatus Limnocylindrales bacterium]